MEKKWLQSRILKSDPIQVGSQRMVVRAHAIQLTLPFLKNTLVWNRPYDVQLQTSDATDSALPVIDLTRIIQMLILASGFWIAMVIRRNNR